MNSTTLEAALPSFTVAVLTAVTATAQVHVAEEPRNVQRGGGASVDVWWQLLDERPEPDDECGLGMPRTALRYRATITGSATQAARRGWLRELRQALDGRAPALLLAVTGFDHARVVVAEPEPGIAEGFGVAGSTGPAREALEVDFVGDVHPDDGGS